MAKYKIAKITRTIDYYENSYHSYANTHRKSESYQETMHTSSSSNLSVVIHIAGSQK